MELEEILSKVDHTNLKQTATWDDMRVLCDEGVKYKVASVCIPPCFVQCVKKTYGNTLKVCTVIGFPNGYNTTEVKVFEASNAVKNGADEIDMVININWLKMKRYDEILSEIKEVKQVCDGKILKVIIETCLLTDEEKVKMCKIVTEAGADYIKTSTGFSTSGASPEDITLFKNNVGQNIKIKAAGGIKSIQDAENFINLGAARLGTSKVIKILEGN